MERLGICLIPCQLSVATLTLTQMQPDILSIHASFRPPTNLPGYLFSLQHTWVRRKLHLNFPTSRDYYCSANMLLSHKSLLTIFRVWFVGCTYLSYCACAPVKTDVATLESDLQLANLKPDQASSGVSLILDKSAIPTEIDIDIDASASADGGQTHPPNGNDDIPGWLALYIAYITWLWGLVTVLVTWIISNVLPVVLFSAACAVTGMVVVAIAYGLVGFTRVVIVGPTERTPLVYRSR